jgi:O-acetyl-ADP-ribose deacetylase (regulator of RNase III)
MRGDLLRQEVDAIVNTVNTVGVMGKGIALQFKQKWPENFRAYEAAYKRGEIRVGEMFVFDAGGLVKPNFIINFPTKRHWRERSRIEYIETGLIDLARQIKRLGIRSIALPPLGCGNGGLAWPEVRALIVGALETLPDVDVLLFEPVGAPPPKELVTRTHRPKMTAGRAAIVKVLSIYREMDYSLTRLEVQKLAYFLERAGQHLELQFVRHRYGPYSDRLRHVLQAMEGHYITGLGDGSTEAEIRLVSGTVEAADEFLSDAQDPEIRERITRVASVIDGFESPYGMELLATVDWVATHEPEAGSVEEATAAVHGWNERKRRVIKHEHIPLAWNRLREQGWISAGK